MIPQCNPKLNYLNHKSEIGEAISRVLEGGKYILGEQVRAFEKEFASFNGSQFGIGVGNGTDALEIALRACGVIENDYVLTVSHTAVATAAAIARINATPIFVDVEKNSFNLDCEQIDFVIKRLEKPPKAIVPVHLYGCPVKMNILMEIAKKHSMMVVEDCSQAHGSLLLNKKVGTFGDFGCFSCYPTKNLGAIGDAGVIVTSNSELAERAVLLREYGWKERYVSSVHGFNSRLDEMQAAILRVKLRYLEEENQKRREIAKLYGQNIKNDSIMLPKEMTNSKSVYHQYAIRNRSRERLKAYLLEKGVSTLVHYPFAIHQQPPFSLPQLRPLPLLNTESVVKEVLSLPIFPELSREESEIVCDALNSFK